MTFRDLGLCDPILSALEKQQYQTPSPIQRKAIPPALEGRDVLGCAQTGTGKTCAFATPILQRLDKAVPGRPVRALILTPTRELALQIYENIEAYGVNLPLRSAVIFGGVAQGPQVTTLKRGVDILVATPGRLGDLYQQKLLDLSKIEIFVLDEADRMLDMGFIHDVKKILKWLPSKKQTLFFSATMPREITELVDSLLSDPVKVAVDPVSSPVEVITQKLYYVDRNNKSALLAHLMKQDNIESALVFTRTKHGANRVVKDLGKFGISSQAIHGNKSQTARQKALADFKSGEIRCLIATDIAARGIDIDKLSHVFNFNLPEVPETYVHRIGRTGRAGRDGVAIAFCDFSEKSLVKDVERLMGKTIPLEGEHPYPMQVFEVPKRDKHGKIINEDDEEARRAGRERRRAKEEQHRSTHQAKKERENLQTIGIEVAPVKQERKRGVRSGQVMETGSAMPNTQVSRPDPLSGDEIMDATARMLAPRTMPKPQRQSNRNQMNNGQQKNDNRKHTEPKKAHKGKGREQEEHKPHHKGATNQHKTSSHYKSAEGHKSGEHGSHSHQNKNRNRTRNSPPRNQFDTPPHAAQTKDSTEQSSLVKPFYLDMK
ncbi:MAG: DEAD/DEAH box helicase [Eubacteriales bacterium]